MVMTRNAKRLWWAQMVLALVLVGGVLGNVAYTNRVDERSRRETMAESRQNDRRWCDLLKTLDSAYTDPKSPSTTPIGVRIAKAIHELVVEFGC